MATVANVSYSDGTSMRFRYRLSLVARYLRQMKAIENFRDIKTTPVIPWLLDMAMADAERVAAGREIASIEILEKVT